MRVEPEQVLEQQRIAALRRIEDADAEHPVGDNQQQRGGQHRSRQHHHQTGGVERPHEDRQPEPGLSRRAQLVRGDDEVDAGHDRRKADDEHARRGEAHMRVAEHGRERRVEGPAGVDAAGDHGIEGRQRPGHEYVPAREVEPRESQVLGPQHQRQQEIAQRRRDRRDQEEPHHDDAVHGEELVVGVVANEVGGRRGELDPYQRRGGAADEEERQQRHQVQPRDALVVGAQQPRRRVPPLGEIAAAVGRFGGGGHGGPPALASDLM